MKVPLLPIHIVSTKQFEAIKAEMRQMVFNATKKQMEGLLRQNSILKSAVNLSPVKQRRLLKLKRGRAVAAQAVS